MGWKYTDKQHCFDGYCDNCGTYINCSMAGDNESPMTYSNGTHRDNALHLKFSDGYGMYTDHCGYCKSYEVIICEKCADDLMEKAPKWFKKFIVYGDINTKDEDIEQFAFAGLIEETVKSKKDCQTCSHCYYINEEKMSENMKEYSKKYRESHGEQIDECTVCVEGSEYYFDWNKLYPVIACIMYVDTKNFKGWNDRLLRSNKDFDNNEYIFKDGVVSDFESYILYILDELVEGE